MNWGYRAIVYDVHHKIKPISFDRIADAEVYLEFKNEELCEHDLLPHYALKLVPYVIGGADDEI